MLWGWYKTTLGSLGCVLDCYLVVGGCVIWWFLLIWCFGLDYPVKGFWWFSWNFNIFAVLFVDGLFVLTLILGWWMLHFWSCWFWYCVWFYFACLRWCRVEVMLRVVGCCGVLWFCFVILICVLLIGFCLDCLLCIKFVFECTI